MNGPVLAALGSAGCFAVSTSLQHHSASAAPPQAGGSRRLLGYLARRPLWLAGTFAGTCGFALHAFALRGPLVVVQPLLVSGLVLAIPVRALLDGRAPSWRSVGWAGLIAGGITLFVMVVNPSPGEPQPDGVVAVLLVAVGWALAAVATGAAARIRDGLVVGLLLGAGSGVLFGLVAGLLKMTTAAVAEGGGTALLSTWAPWVLLACGGWGLALNQRAYRAAPLAISMPVLNIITPLVAIGFGVSVFGEKPADRPGTLILECAGLLAMAIDVLQLARTTAAPSPDAPHPAAVRRSEPVGESA